MWNLGKKILHMWDNLQFTNSKRLAKKKSVNYSDFLNEKLRFSEIRPHAQGMWDLSLGSESKCSQYQNISHSVHRYETDSRAG